MVDQSVQPAHANPCHNLTHMATPVSTTHIPSHSHCQNQRTYTCARTHAHKHTPPVFHMQEGVRCPECYHAATTSRQTHMHAHTHTPSVPISSCSKCVLSGGPVTKMSHIAVTLSHTCAHAHTRANHRRDQLVLCLAVTT